MAGIRDDIKEDFEYLNKRVVKYNMALKTITSEDRPACFKPDVEEESMQMLCWGMRTLVSLMQNILSKGD